MVPFFIKTAYDEPSFADKGGDYPSIHRDIHNSLGQELQASPFERYRDAKAELLSDYKDDFDFVELGKMAIDFSDGVIEADQNVNAELPEVCQKRKRSLSSRYPGEDFAEPYAEFPPQGVP